MKSPLSRLFPLMACLAALALGACTSARIQPASASFAPYPAATVERAIYKGCHQRNWAARKLHDGLIEATLTRRSHNVVVWISYSASGYQIQYRDSINLNYNGRSRIHKRYNEWVNYLNISIRSSFPNASAAQPDSLRQNLREYWQGNQ